jgi:hypothetical protein
MVAVGPWAECGVLPAVNDSTAVSKEKAAVLVPATLPTVTFVVK